MWKCGKTEGRLQPADVTLPNCFHTEGWASGAKQPLMPGARQPESEGRHTLAFLCSVGIFCPLKLKTRSRRRQVAVAVQVTSFTDKYVSWGHFKTGAQTEEACRDRIICHDHTEDGRLLDLPLLFQHRGGLAAVNSQKGHKNTHRHLDTHAWASRPQLEMLVMLLSLPACCWTLSNTH